MKKHFIAEVSRMPGFPRCSEWQGSFSKKLLMDLKSTFSVAKLTDDTCYTMEPLSLSIGAFHCVSLCEINFIRHPEFCTVRK